MIKEITSDSELLNSVDVIKRSFATVADEFNLTVDNCPTHPSFITREQMVELKNKGLMFFGLFTNGSQVGFIAVEKANDGVYYIEKLAVLPGYRHKWHGRSLMLHAMDYIRKSKGIKISIGIINDHTVLKDWYRTFGFTETATKTFSHLPFTVCFMEKIL